MMLKSLYTLLAVFILHGIIFAQSIDFKGKVTEIETGDVLVSANVFIVELNRGTTTNSDGEFLINLPKEGNYTVKISYLGYKTFLKSLKILSGKIYRINLKPEALLLSETIVKGKRAENRETPVAFTEMTSRDIELKLGPKEAVNILEGTPGVYVSEQGGGVGDLRLNLRGFDQTNIAVMVNGIPINNPENGEIYWSNWAGIADLVDYVQVQRGLSATPYSVSSVGGSVNFVTRGSGGLKPGVKVKTEFGANNLKKASVVFSTLLKDNIGLTGLVSRRTWNGYADQVYSDEFTYYFDLSMIFGKHSFEFQLMGSPQKHGQRLTPQSINTWNNRGLAYNSDWGYLNGKPLNLRDNSFHKPTLNITYNWEINNDLIWTNNLSLSHGEGGGTVAPWFPFFSKTTDGLIDFDKEWAVNTNNVDSNYHNTKSRAILALRKGIHQHDWATMLSVLKFKSGNYLLTAGIDGKYYVASNFNELSNLLGGDYYVGSSDVNANPNRLLTVGNKVDFNADSFTRNYGGFLQAEFKNDFISAYLNMSAANTGYNRIDYFNYLENDSKRETGWKEFTSYTFKAGANINIDKNNNFYFNAGRFSKAPLSQSVYTYTNDLYKNLKNEQILSLEFGYGIKTEVLNLNINYFYTSWKDKAFNTTFVGNDNKLYYYNIYGAAAEHNGVELDSKLKLTKKLRLDAMFSHSTNKWTNDVQAYIRPESSPANEFNYSSFINGLYVGNFPMTTASVAFYYEENFNPNVTYYFNPVYNFFGRYYSQFDPTTRSVKTNIPQQSWRIPDHYRFDVHTGFEYKVDSEFIKNIGVSFHLLNVMDSKYIIDAIDGASHDADGAVVWFGRQRTWHTSLYLNF